MVVRAISSPDSSSESNNNKIAPLQLESPIGQFLSQILVNHPHLVPAAVDQQLDQLQTDRDADQQNQDPSPTTTDLVLYRFVCLFLASFPSFVIFDVLYILCYLHPVYDLLLFCQLIFNI